MRVMSIYVMRMIRSRTADVKSGHLHCSPSSRDRAVIWSSAKVRTRLSQVGQHLLRGIIATHAMHARARVSVTGTEV